ncbi:type II toxin-antitoxin system Phd/YefM family antitoxin [Parasalinivibrio latis]|uniref:type II toxin-antitoxin system prevent-host-death family antitoxin n=1 Tax=Parasalinivibrio latis TaxID=2952610 RepID=UPI0006CFF242
MTITANDVKVRGIKVIKEAIEDGLPHAVTERGKPAFYAISVEDYAEFQEWRLDKAIREAEAEYTAGNHRTITDIDAYVDGLVDDKD